MASAKLEHLPARGAPSRAPLLFVHGAFGTPWMWLHRYAPWFSDRGHDGHALGLRSGLGPAEPGLADYLDDLESAVARIGRAPVIVAHSLGALVAQRALGRVPMRGLALLAPVPPTGMLWSSLRLALTAPAVWLQTAMAAADSRLASHQATREALFTRDTCAKVVADTHRNLRAQPMRPLLEAQWPCYVPRAGRLGVPAMTLAAGADRLIPVEAVERTARHHGARHRTLQGVGHALMLDDRWEAGAQALGDWLETIA